MPISLWLSIIVWIIGALFVIAWLASRGSRKRGGEYVHGGIPLGIFAFSLIFFVFTIFTVVPTRSVGVVTQFNKPVGTLDNGFHLKAPWNQVQKLDGTIQTNSRTGTDNNPTGTNGASCTDVRLGTNLTSCVDNSVRWRIKTEAGKRLYQDYPDGIDQIRRSLVQRQLTSALNDVLGQYDPLVVTLDAEGKPTGTTMQAANLTEFSAQVKDALVKRVGNDIEIQDVIVPIIRFDKTTQSKINALQDQVAQTRIAEEAVKTADKQAEAANKLKAAVSNEPNVLVSRCLDAFEEMVKEKQSIPIGFSCWPGGSASSVVLPKS